MKHSGRKPQRTTTLFENSAAISHQFAQPSPARHQLVVNGISANSFFSESHANAAARANLPARIDNTMSELPDNGVGISRGSVGSNEARLRAIGRGKVRVVIGMPEW